MSITGTGFIIILLGIYAFFLNRKLLYNLTIFFIPFSATAVINFGEEGNGSAIQPFMFLGSLWLFSTFSYKLTGKKYNSKYINKAELLSILLLFGFILTAFVSLIMPIIINKTERGNVTGGLGLSEPIFFSTRNITQYIYLLFGGFFSIGIYLHNRNIGNFLSTIKVYTWSVIFVVIWGGVELFCYYKNIEYPAYLFNNSYNPSAAGYKMFADSSGELKRISSVGIEPSILVQSIVVLIPFLLFGLYRKRYIFNKFSDLIIVIVLYCFTIRTTSSSGILCLTFLSILSIIVIYKRLSIISKILLIATSIVSIPLVALMLYYLFQDIITKMLFEKGESFSSLERLSSIIDAWETFKSHPFLGTGWGSVSSFDLFVKILSNTGVIGFCFFTGFLMNVLINKIYSYSTSRRTEVLNISVTVSFSTIIFSNMINTFSFIFGFFWLISGLAIIKISK